MYNLFYAGRPIIVDSLGVILFAALVALGMNPAQAAAIGVATTVGHVLILRFLGRPVAPLQWMSLILVVASGLATYATEDPRFVMVKPTLIYTAVGIVMLKPGWMLRYIPPVAKAHVEDVATRFGYVWAGLFFVTGAANLAVALAFTAWWPAFVATVPLASKLILFAVQFAVTRRIARVRIRGERDGAGEGRPAAAAGPNLIPTLLV
jgi:intracellular septation protein